MPRGDRGKRSQNLIAAGLGAVALFATVILAFAIGDALGVNSGRDQITAREHYEDAKQDQLRACVGREGPAAIKCVSEAIEAAQEQSDSRQDLYAQRDMSRWAFWLLILTGITVAITAVGVWFVKRTLEATLEAVEDTGRATNAMLDANNIARLGLEATNRPWLVGEILGPFAPSVSQAVIANGPSVHWAQFSVIIRNLSAAPALILKREILIDGGSVLPTFPLDIRAVLVRGEILDVAEENPAYLDDAEFRKLRFTGPNEPDKFPRFAQIRVNQDAIDPPNIQIRLTYETALGELRQFSMGLRPRTFRGFIYLPWGGEAVNYDRKIGEAQPSGN